MLKKVLTTFVMLLGICAAAEIVWQFKADNVEMLRNSQLSESAPGVWRVTQSQSRPNFRSRDIIPVNPDATYEFSIKYRTADPGAKIWVTVSSFDKNGREFEPVTINYARGNHGKLAELTRAGSVKFKVDGAEKWPRIARSGRLCFNAATDYSDLPNRNISPIIKSISPDGTVELASPLRRSYAAGTVVRRHWAAGPADTVVNCPASKTFVVCKGVKKGIAKSGRESGKFMLKTAGVKIGVGAVGKEFEIMEVTVTETIPADKQVVLGEGANPELVAKARKGGVRTAHLSWWGFKKDDSTDIIQDAINSGVRTLIIDKMASPWITSPLTLRSNLEVVFAEGAEMLAKKGEYKRGTDSVFSASGCDDLVIRGEGTGGVIRMHKSDYMNPKLYRKAEWRCCIFVRGGKNIRIENMTVQESGGDGILITRLKQNFPDNVTVRNVRALRNYRQGISVICGRNILIENCDLSGTSGTPPASGIDLESNGDDEMMNNIVVRNCRMTGNAGHGIIVSVTRMNTSRVEPLGLTFENCVLTDNYLGDIAFCSRTRWPREHRLDGTVKFRNITAVNTKHDHVRRYPIDMEMDVVHGVDFEFDNISITRGPGNRPAIRVAVSNPRNGMPPGVRLNFVNMKFTDTEPDDRLRVYDHSFSGDTSWISGLSYTPEKQFAPVAPFAGKVPAPVEQSGREYKPVFQIFEPDFWVYGTNGSSGEITLEYRNLGRACREAEVAVIAPDGARRKLGTLKPGTDGVFKFRLDADGYHKIEVRGHYSHVALKKSTLPAGMYVDANGADILSSTGTVYFDVPENAEPFAVRLWGRSNVLWIGAELYTPDGEKVWDVRTNMEQFEPTDEQLKKSGRWKLVLKHPHRGYFAKYHLALPGLPPYISID